MSDEARPSAGIDESILDTLYLLSQRYHSHGLYESASQLLDFLLRHDPMRAAFHFALGKALHGDARHGKAVLSYQRAVKLGLPDTEVHFYLGQCLIYEGRFPDAAVALNQFLGLAQAKGQTLSQPDSPIPLPGASQAPSPQVERARHLLEQIVMPRLRPASDSRRDPGAPARLPAGQQAPRQAPMESTR